MPFQKVDLDEVLLGFSYLLGSYISRFYFKMQLKMLSLQDKMQI